MFEQGAYNSETHRSGLTKLVRKSRKRRARLKALEVEH